MTIPDYLTELEGAEDSGHRLELIRLAGENGGRRTAKRLAALFGTVSDVEEEAIARALVRIGDPAVPPLCRLLGEGQTNCEHHAIQALGEIGSPAGAVPLARALGDWRPAVREAASGALLNLIDRGHARAVWLAMPAAVAQLERSHGWDDNRGPLAAVYRKLDEVLKIAEALPVPSGAPPVAPHALPLPASESIGAAGDPPGGGR